MRLLLFPLICIRQIVRSKPISSSRIHGTQTAFTLWSSQQLSDSGGCCCVVVVGRGNSDLLGARVPHMWFAHMLTSAEMLFMVYTGVEAFSTQSQWSAPFLSSPSWPTIERQRFVLVK